MCETYAVEFGVTYNAKKSMCMLFTRQRASTHPDITLNGQKMDWVDQVKHLGSILSRDLKEDKEIQYKEGDLVGRVNSLLGNLGDAPAGILRQVFLSDCCHFYSATAWQFRDASVQSFHTMWNRCVRRIYRLPYKTHTRFLPHILNARTSDEQICQRFLLMVKRMCSSNNARIRNIANRGLQNCSTIIGENLSYIKCKSGINKDALMTLGSRLTFHRYSDNDKCTLLAICELAQSRCEIFTNTEQQYFLNYLYIC